MKRLTVFAGCVLFAVGGQVAAGCSAPSVRVEGNGNNSLPKTLRNNTVCGIGVGLNAGDRWQEWHRPNGTLTEYAKGPNDPVDPTHDVGTWDATNGTGATVTYNYGTGGTYTWVVYNNGEGSYSFCTGPNGTEIATATLSSGQVSCGF